MHRRSFRVFLSLNEMPLLTRMRNVDEKQNIQLSEISIQRIVSLLSFCSDFTYTRVETRVMKEKSENKCLELNAIFRGIFRPFRTSRQSRRSLHCLRLTQHNLTLISVSLSAPHKVCAVTVSSLLERLATMSK